jgi:hypothetical protein
MLDINRTLNKIRIIPAAGIAERRYFIYINGEPGHDE